MPAAPTYPAGYPQAAVPGYPQVPAPGYPQGYPAAAPGWPLAGDLGIAAEAAAATLLTAPPYATPYAPQPGAATPYTGVPGIPAPGVPMPPPPPVDPLTAPLGAVLGQPVVGDPNAPALATWPCVECGSHNAMHLDACHVCTAPFGGKIARLHDVKGTRRRYMLMMLGGMLLFLMLLSLLTFAGTDATTVPDGVDPALVDSPIDYSTLPQE